jgi:AcrR family transcriptional regulator
MLTGRDRGPIWTRPAPGSRQPRFTREQIADAAIAIADRQGFAEVSMRRIAERIGAATMTLYHYVRTKDDLLALMDDALMARALVPAAEMPRGWRAGLEAIARRTRDVMVKHPWALDSPQGTRMGPNGLRHIEQSLAAVADLPLGPDERLQLIAVVDDYVFGHALRAAESMDERVLDARAARSIDELVTGHLATGEFPHLVDFIGKDKPSRAFQRALKTMNDDARFAFGLKAILDGAARRVRGSKHVEPGGRGRSGRGGRGTRGDRS